MLYAKTKSFKYRLDGEVVIISRVREGLPFKSGSGRNLFGVNNRLHRGQIIYFDTEKLDHLNVDLMVKW